MALATIPTISINQKIPIARNAQPRLRRSKVAAQPLIFCTSPKQEMPLSEQRQMFGRRFRAW